MPLAFPQHLARRLDRRVRRPRARTWAATLLTVAVAATGCSDGQGAESQQTEPSAAAQVQRYVALGDSFTAAPFVPNVVEADGCYRSTSNYPSLVARSLPQAELVDASCSGADTMSMTGPQETMTGGRAAPQFEALTPETDLVTVGIGGNDFDVFRKVVTRCVEVARNAPDGAPCRRSMTQEGGDRLEQRIERTGRRVARVLEGIRERAPEARVLVVTYPQITPAEGTCPELPLATGDYEYTRQVSVWLDGALRSAADAAGAELVDVWSASEGHDVCSEQPWVNGKDTDMSKALSFHPFAEGQAEVARLVLETIG